MDKSFTPQDVIQCKKCGTFSIYVNDEGLCEDCQPYTMDDKLKEEASNNDI